MERREVLPDVPQVAAPLVGALLAAADAFGARCIDVLGFQARVLDLLRVLPPREALAAHVARTMDERCTQVLARRRHAAPPGRDDAVSLIYLKPGEAQPCHSHNNIVCTLVLLSGSLSVREFDRVGPARGGGVLLRLLFDGVLRPGDYLQAREAHRNAHWLAAGTAPAVLLSITLRGYERDTFYAPGERKLGHVLLDPTQPAGDGLLLGRPITGAEADRKFGGRPLCDFPMPVPPMEAEPNSLGATA